MANREFFIVTYPNGKTDYVSANYYGHALSIVKATCPKGTTVTQPQKYGMEPALRPSGHTW